MFKSRDIDKPDQVNYLQWSPFDKKTDYFDPSKKEFMINYRVQNIEEFVKVLKVGSSSDNFLKPNDNLSESN